MVQAYNFIGSWQLFPERGTYDFGERPKSGIYKIQSNGEEKQLYIEHNWVTLENQAFNSSYTVQAGSGLQPMEHQEIAEASELDFPDGITLIIKLYRSNELWLELLHELQPNGYLKLTQKGRNETGEAYTNVEIFHKQLSVLPYSASVSGAVIKHTEEGVIRHKALTAMEEQTNMQLEQIRKQIELLAIQAQEIQKRKELSMIIYGAQLNFQPVIGQIYYLYERKDGSHLLSMVSPKEWGRSAPFKKAVASVKLLADHTWTEIL
ncbi:MAG: DUF2452 domain-containing protein [Chitinophagaceae bacterium]|nr:DUF2452 domain-containing protein [Chitinophagaceae bacterium]